MQKMFGKGWRERLKKKPAKPSACRAVRALQGFGGTTKAMNFGDDKGNHKDEERP